MSASQPRRRVLIGLGCLLALAAAIVYSNTFDVPFLFDDELRIEENPNIRKLLPMSIPMENTPRPIGMYTFAINYALHGYRVWGYHVTNLAIHIFAGLTLFGIARRTLPRNGFVDNYSYSATSLAFAIAFIWLVHPLTTQAVTYIVQRLESLMALCYLATLYCFIRAVDSSRRIVWYAASITFCAAGMGIKEVMVTAPLMVLWYDRVFVSKSWRALFGDRWRYYMCLFGTWGILAWCMLRAPTQFVAGNMGVVKGVSPLNYILSQAGVITHYLRLTVWPYGQCFDYAWPVAHTAREIVPPLLFISALVVATIWAVFRRPAWGFLGGWFFVILSPTSSFVPIIDLAFEQRMYLPLAAVGAAIVFIVNGAINYLARRGSFSLARMRFAGAFLIAVLALQMSVLTWGRNELYRSEVGIWEDTVSKAPHSARAHNNLAAFLHQNGEYNRAFIHCQRALEILPNYADAHSNMGVILTKQGQLDAAIAHHRRALELDPSDAKVHAKIGVTLLKKGLREEALAHFHLAVALRPSSAESRWNLAKALAECGRITESLHQYRESLRIRPGDPQILYDVAVTLDQAERIDEAIEAYRQVVKLAPELAKAHHNLAVALMTRGNLDEAILYFRRAIDADPELAVPHLGLGDALASRGQTDDAIEEYKKALAIQPNDQLARDRLHRLHNKKSQ